MKSTMKGRFTPKNPTKYIGNPNNIFFRSSWEYRYMQWLDITPAIVRWGSEELKIMYINPLKITENRLTGSAKQPLSAYYPDFVIMYQDKSNNIKKAIIEIKPYRETVLSPKSTERDKMAFIVNTAKWKAATAFAQQQGAEFKVITEKTMFVTKAKK